MKRVDWDAISKAFRNNWMDVMEEADFEHIWTDEECDAWADAMIDIMNDTEENE